MDRGDLRRFLGTVRKQRFIDYLDPLGETPMQAFERRLRWAERVWDDPAATEEAEFLLKNSDDLRRVVAREATEDESADWVEGVAAGSEGLLGKVVRKDSSVDMSGIEGVQTPTPVPERRVEPPRLPRPGASKLPAPGVSAGTGKPAAAKKTDDSIGQPMLGIMKIEDVTPVSPLERIAPPSSGTPLGMASASSSLPLIMSLRPSRREEAPVRRRGGALVVLGLMLGVGVVGLVGGGWWWTHRVVSVVEAPVDPPEPVPLTPVAVEPVLLAVDPTLLPVAPEAPRTKQPGKPPGAEKPPRPPPPTGTRPPLVAPVAPPPVVPPVELPPVEPPAPVVAAFSAKGLWTGRAGDKSFILDVKRVDGSVVVALADVQRPDGYVHIELVGTWDADKQALELRDPFNGGVFRVAIRDGKFVGHAIMGPGQPQVPLGLSRL